ncbi:hypothetical protein ECANGB1_2355 [Enterospora canceri]|uniref:Uncharacterized protein n=1 Tax=Enterospora canceri TaxID=1081671 RepID=A0A1Y1S9C1_9MICR|nr:hypothetical protein ECANGB1_2355 [Enterospora canceri]
MLLFLFHQILANVVVYSLGKQKAHRPCTNDRNECDFSRIDFGAVIKIEENDAESLNVEFCLNNSDSDCNICKFCLNKMKIVIKITDIKVMVPFVKRLQLCLFDGFVYYKTTPNNKIYYFVVQDPHNIVGIATIAIDDDTETILQFTAVNQNFPYAAYKYSRKIRPSHKVPQYNQRGKYQFKNLLATFIGIIIVVLIGALLSALGYLVYHSTVTKQYRIRCC